MSDFKKKGDQDEAQHTPTDDMAPVPSFNIATDIPALDETNPDNQQSKDDQETDKMAAPMWHPSWEKVQQRFEEEIATRNPAGGANTHRELPADEFKIRMIVDSDVVGILETIMEDVKRAVESVESRPKPAKRSQPGA